MVEDQVDFVQYCLRRCTMLSFTEFLKFQDIIMSHKIFQKAAFIASKILLQLHENPEETRQNCNVIPDSMVNASQKEKQLHNGSMDDGWVPRKEKPLLANKLLEETTEPLVDFQEYVELLEKYEPTQTGNNTSSCITWALAMQLYMQQNQPAKAMRALKHGLTALTVDKNQAACGFFIGIAIKFVNGFDKTSDDILGRLFDDLA